MVESCSVVELPDTPPTFTLDLPRTFGGRPPDDIPAPAHHSTSAEPTHA